MQRLFALFAPVLFLAASCSEPATPPDAPAAGRVAPSDSSAARAVPYAFGSPAAAFDLAPDLREASALTVLANGNLATVQDEAGILYELDPATGAIVGEQEFKRRGDFEGVERVGTDVWALASDGDLYRIRRAGTEVDAERFETALANRNDAEGLAYDAANERLLVACKENPGNGLGRVRAVYAFDLRTNTLSPAPVFTLDRRLVDGRQPFKPSALAIRPATGEVYVLSSVRKAIAILSPSGALETVVDLPEALFAQPEGIAFAPDGTLYISNEGPRGPATLLRFDPTDR